MKARYIHLYIILLLCGVSDLPAQPTSLWIPPQYQQVYDDSLHMYDGTPGPNYWQNHAEYDIQVEVNPSTRMLTGQETITYYNESPDTLSEIVIQLNQDIYKRGAARTFLMQDSSIHDGLQISHLWINGRAFDMMEGDNYQRQFTLAIITLPDSVLPETSLTLSLAWEVPMPIKGYRTGFVDSTSAFVGYWYPQVAVYDAISGWDRFPYVGWVEFYQDYADFQVAITLPDSFVVWGTGLLHNPEDLLSPRTLRRYRRAQRSNEVVHIVDSSDIVTGDILQKNGQHTWLFTAERVPDFAFALSDHYSWDGAQLDFGNGQNTVFIQSGYASDTTHFAEVVEMSQTAIQHFTEVMPGVKYPYPALFIFDADDGLPAGNGMEFPMMINQKMHSQQADYHRSVGVTFHEIAHMYFPFYVGTDEKRFAWMDEGFAMYLPWEGQTAYADTAFIPKRDIQIMHTFYEQFYDLPLLGSSDFYIQDAYEKISYGKPLLAWLTMEDLLGKDTIRTVLHEFIHRWEGKHPLPWDLFFTFNDVLDEDLSWFWRPWFYEAHIPDIGINTVVKSGDAYWVILENHGGLPSPVDLTVTYADSTTEDIHQTARIWAQGNSTYQFPVKSAQKILSVELVEKMAVDMDDTNNQFILNTR